MNQLQQYLIVVRLDDTPAGDLDAYQHVDARMALTQVDASGLLEELAVDERAAVLLVAERLRAAGRGSKTVPGSEGPGSHQVKPTDMDS